MALAVLVLAEGAARGAVRRAVSAASHLGAVVAHAPVVLAAVGTLLARAVAQLVDVALVIDHDPLVVVVGEGEVGEEAVVLRYAGRTRAEAGHASVSAGMQWQEGMLLRAAGVAQRQRTMGRGRFFSAAGGGAGGDASSSSSQRSTR